MQKVCVAILLPWLKLFEGNPAKEKKVAEQIWEEWNQNSNQSLSLSRLFQYLSAKYIVI
jgi:hypothetical protein